MIRPSGTIQRQLPVASSQLSVASRVVSLSAILSTNDRQPIADNWTLSPTPDHYCPPIFRSLHVAGPLIAGISQSQSKRFESPVMVSKRRNLSSTKSNTDHQVVAKSKSEVDRRKEFHAIPIGMDSPARALTMYHPGGKMADRHCRLAVSTAPDHPEFDTLTWHVNSIRRPLWQLNQFLKVITQ
jgi:hypothetical protein